MLPKKTRMARKEFRSGSYQTVKTPYFSLKIKKSSGEEPKIGIIAGKAVHKSAVKRNFWKRQARQALVKGKISGKDMIMIFSARVEELSKKEFQEELSKILRSIK